MNENIFEGIVVNSGIADEATEDEDVRTADIREEDDDDDAEDKLKPSRRSIIELLAHMRTASLDDEEEDIFNSDDNEDDDTEFADADMDADDYHNRAVEYARRGKCRKAADLCMQGLSRLTPEVYKCSVKKAEAYAEKNNNAALNVDLLADTIQYSLNAGDMVTAAKHYAILKDMIPYSRWNWRAFTFAFDFLIAGNPVANEADCREIIENYKRYLPYEEKARIAESELESALGNGEKSMNVLREAVTSLSNACQCALRLADIQMDRGYFDDVVETANYGIAASAATQPSVNIPYFYFIRALAKDHILHRKEASGVNVTKDEVTSLTAEYELMIKRFPALARHFATIKMRINMLEFIKAV